MSIRVVVIQEQNKCNPSSPYCFHLTTRRLASSAQRTTIVGLSLPEHA